MGQQTLNVNKLILRGGSSSEWSAADPVLSVREFGVDTSFSPARFKIGDGVKKWSELQWAGTLVEASTTNGNIKVNGSEVTVYTLPAIGTAGTYCKVTTDAQGRVTVGANLAASDIPSITLSKVSDAGTAASQQERRYFRGQRSSAGLQRKAPRGHSTSPCSRRCIYRNVYCGNDKIKRAERRYGYRGQ